MWQQYQAAVTALAEALGFYFDEARRLYYYDEVTLKSWVLGDGGRSGNCPLCVENADEGEIDMDATFPSGDGEPPGHPNAVLAGSTFLPYGRLERMVSAEYDGFAVFLRAGNYTTTIGPNHPMLTARGLVPAKLIKVGDKLVYDGRAVNGPAVREANLDEVECVEDVFASLKSTCGLANVSGSRDDFHGDSIREKEIQIVFPNGELRNVLEPGRIKELREIPFVLSNVETQDESSFRSFSADIHRIFLAPPGSMGSGDVNHFELLTVKDIRIGDFKGSAFDAATSVGLYCSDGFVVSNCTCSVEYRDTRKRVYV